MPQLKQPASLKDTSMKFLVTFFANDFHKHSTEGSLLNIRRCVAVLKQEICPEMTLKLEAEFCYKLIKEFLWSCDGSIERPTPHIRAVAEVIMDRKIIGLKCTYRLLNFLEPKDTRRILGLQELNLGWKVTHIMGNFHLEDIAKFVYRENCTDSDLEIIGQNCRKLSHLDVRFSIKVTDIGLSALRGCPDLQFVYVWDCSLSESGVIDFLSANKKIREFDEYCIQDSVSLTNSSVYPSIKSLGIIVNFDSTERLVSISDRFPNLEVLEVDSENAEDLEELKYLRRLSHLTLYGDDNLFLYENIEEVFRFIGANILSFTLSDVDAKQRDVDFIFDAFSNLEYFNFWYGRETVEKLVIPTHRNIKRLYCYSHHSCVMVQFGRMPKLEELILDGFELSTDEIEGIVFDHINFPRLKKLQFERSSNSDGFGQIRETVKAKNLDIELVDIDTADRTHDY